jgi:hypothetical protein
MENQSRRLERNCLLPTVYSLAGLERYGAEREHNGTSRPLLFCNHVADNPRGGPPEL